MGTFTLVSSPIKATNGSLAMALSILSGRNVARFGNADVVITQSAQMQRLEVRYLWQHHKISIIVDPNDLSPKGEMVLRIPSMKKMVGVHLKRKYDTEAVRVPGSKEEQQLMREIEDIAMSNIPRVSRFLGAKVKLEDFYSLPYQFMNY